MPGSRRTTGPRRWFTVREAAAYTKFGTRTIRARIAEGVLPAYLPRGSRVLRIDGDDLDDLIAGDGRIPAAHLGDGHADTMARARAAVRTTPGGRPRRASGSPA
jgi:excisionase family DNA binding protein